MAGWKSCRNELSPSSQAIAADPAGIAGQLLAWITLQSTALLRAGGGAAIILVCLALGTAMQRLGVPAPGSVVGMALLLALLKTGKVPEAWVRAPCACLLLILPALFVPLYVAPLADPGFWARYGLELLPIATVGAAITLGIAGWLAWRVRAA